MILTAAGHRFATIDFDSEGDTLYLVVDGARTAATTLASEEGHAVDLDPEGGVAAVELVNVRALADRDGRLSVTVPGQVALTFTADELSVVLRGARAATR